MLLIRLDIQVLSIDYWVLITEYWLLSIDYQVLSIDYRVLITEYWLLTIDYWVLSTEYWDRQHRLLIVMNIHKWKDFRKLKERPKQSLSVVQKGSPLQVLHPIISLSQQPTVYLVGIFSYIINSTKFDLAQYFPAVLSEPSVCDSINQWIDSIIGKKKGR